MLRRPLERPSKEFGLVGRWLKPSIGLPPYMVHAPASFYTFENEKAVSAALGFSATPDVKDFYPLKPLSGQHRKTFLQWGWAQDKRQIAFEMGDASTILSLHFRRNNPGQGVFHLDTIEIDDGQKDGGDVIAAHIPCDDAGYAVHVKNVFQSVQTTLPLLNNDAALQAEKAFHARLDPLMRELDLISEQMRAEHAAQVMGGVAPAFRP